MRTVRALVWIAVALAGAASFAMVAFVRGEPVSAGYLLVAAVCTFAIAYRFYSKFLAVRVLMLDDRRTTPALRFDDGRDFVPTNRWVAFGHHFAAIAGPGPLLGPTLAAQFGYLPGTIWILAGVVLGGAVQDFVILAISLRRDGRSLAKLAHDSLGRRGALAATTGIVLIIVILIAVLALVVVNLLAESPWGLFTVATTIPIAMLMGLIMRGHGGRRVLLATAIGLALLGLGLAGGHAVAGHATLGPAFTLGTAFGGRGHPVRTGRVDPADVAPAHAARLPLDVRQAGHGVPARRRHRAGPPRAEAPGGDRLRQRHRPFVRRKDLSFLLHQIACGAISSFHALVASGTTRAFDERDRRAHGRVPEHAAESPWRSWR